MFNVFFPWEKFPLIPFLQKEELKDLSSFAKGGYGGILRAEPARH
jgi:hypothetical protein